MERRGSAFRSSRKILFGKKNSRLWRRTLLAPVLGKPEQRNGRN